MSCGSAFQIDAAALIQRAASGADVGVADIVGRSRYQEVVRARWAVARVLRSNGWTLARIGRKLGGRDHSTIGHACEQAEILHGTDVEFARLCARVASL